FSDLHECCSQIALAPWRPSPLLEGDITRFAVEETDGDLKSFVHVAREESKRLFALAHHAQKIRRHRRLLSEVRFDFFFCLQKNVHSGKSGSELDNGANLMSTHQTHEIRYNELHANAVSGELSNLLKPVFYLQDAANRTSVSNLVRN